MVEKVRDGAWSNEGGCGYRTGGGWRAIIANALLPTPGRRPRNYGKSDWSGEAGEYIAAGPANAATGSSTRRTMEKQAEKDVVEGVRYKEEAWRLSARADTKPSDAGCVSLIGPAPEKPVAGAVPCWTSAWATILRPLNLAKVCCRGILRSGTTPVFAQVRTPSVPAYYQCDSRGAIHRAAEALAAETNR